MSQLVIVRTAAFVAAAGLCLIAIFQLYVTAGGDGGGAAGNVTRNVSAREIIGGVLSVIPILGSAFAVLGRSGMWRGNFHGYRWATWGVVVWIGVATVGKLASDRAWDSNFWGPAGLVLGLLCAIVAWGGKRP